MQIKEKTKVKIRLLIRNFKTARRHFAELSDGYYGSKSHWDQILTRDTRVGKKSK
jgi:hypothetical protein